MNTAGSTVGTAALDDVAALGGPFVVPTGAGSGAGSVAVGELTGDPVAVRGRVERAKVLLGTDEDRVAASWVFTGVAARLLAPSLAALALHRWVPVLDELRWCPDADPPLRAPVAAGHEGADAAVLRRELLTTAGRLVATSRTATPVAAGLLWGELAASVVKAGRLVTRHRPTAAEAVALGVAALLAGGPLGVTVTAAPDFARRTCCLAYRVPGGRTCADCVLGPARAGAEVLRRGRRAGR